ncbi:probable inactive shikimate kinase like 2, chloroplastic [Selaginella moellendorffii]|uniref:probable inactive shikimate kinase like 2, chloroplastic n=1 Tax=Selaginella moellendorffii TaxID=88036 RepID=UPI000D1C3035|nr:probable inactive shikimate kinase like 2, chloroplastic [Selaginella moellendorffii]|eukprot:XP_024518563.1 probable inactive shikimate kinase like 2, chloroplastic [Selaginella moellendorffii]
MAYPLSQCTALVFVPPPSAAIFAPSNSRLHLTGGSICNRSTEALKKVSRCGSASSSINFDYQFRDDGGELELRLQVPPDHEEISSKNVAINAHDLSLDVALMSQKGIRTLLSIPRLYSRIKPIETMWFIDEDEIVLSLKKQDVTQPWPGLLEAWEYLGKGVAGMLKATSIYIVGDSTLINSAVAKELALALGYVPLESKKLMEQLLKTSLDDYAKLEGPDAVAELECKVFETLSKQLRVVVATLGGDQGAASKPHSWRFMYAGFTVWLSRSQSQDEAGAEKEAVKAKEGSVVYSKAETVVALSGWEDGAARDAAEGCLRALKYLIESDKELPGNKSLYVRLGARGDWPNIMPPGWDPAA